MPDAYADYAQHLFRLLPATSGRVLELGCGEGRVCRDLTSRSYRVADAAALPFVVEEFGLVVAYNSLMDVDDLERVVREAARALEPRGQFVICVTHPFAAAGVFASVAADAPFLVRGSYLARRQFEGPPIQRNGATMAGVNDLETVELLGTRVIPNVMSRGGIQKAIVA